jgi:anti-sigma factor RsiW
MTCDKQLLVQAYFDGELDAAGAVDVESHLATCAECAAWLGTAQRLRTDIRNGAPLEPAPPRLISAIGAALDREERLDRPAPRRTTGWSTWGIGRRRPALVGVLSGALGAAVGAALAVAVILPGTNARLYDEVTTAHVRSLMANHLVDVASTNEHTVKPWFDGRVDIAPPVADFAPDGFELIGGRAEYVGGKRIPAVVYRKGGHIINLFIWPAGGGQPDGLREQNGFHILTWRSGDLVFCAISDIAPDQLRTLARLVEAETARTRKE